METLYSNLNDFHPFMILKPLNGIFTFEFETIDSQMFT
jgi:hypothetical protein